MPLSRIEEIVETANALKPDITVLLGDYVGGLPHFKTGRVPPREWAPVLGRLSAPLGTYAILGNHDWWENVHAVRMALAAAGIPVLENDARLIRPQAAPAFWLAGLGDQLAYPVGRGRFRGADDMARTLAQISDDATPAILLAHEPDIFPKVPGRFGLTLSGHTHGGQVRLPLLGRPIVPSRFGQRYAYGHVVEKERHLVVSGGLGLSNLPIRLGVPPEIVLLEIG
jgi:predicted MPP superfamily phosphohydrolase